jgi:single stranded DNA-binding protein
MPITQILTGWIQKDAALRYTPKGDPVFSFTLSTPAGTEKQEDGTEKRKYTYTRCTIWGDLAEDANENYAEGNLVEVKGWLKAGKPWTPQNASEPRSSIEFTAFEIAHVK